MVTIIDQHQDRVAAHAKRVAQADEHVKKIRKLNELLRDTMGMFGGKLILTQGVMALEEQPRSDLLGKIVEFKDFTEDNDPYLEGDFGSVEQDGIKYFWKIDYYNKELTEGSPDPADGKVTTRVLTIMRADEY